MIDPDNDFSKKDDEQVEQPSPKVFRFMVEMKAYPMKCPHCGESVEYDGQLYPRLYPVGVTKAKFSERRKKRVEASQVKLMEEEGY